MTATERLELLIYPRTAETEAEADAFNRAVAAQEAFETARGTATVDANVSSVSNDGVSVTYRPGSGGFMAGISPDALEILRKYGLLPTGFPQARRIC